MTSNIVHPEMTISGMVLAFMLTATPPHTDGKKKVKKKVSQISSNRTEFLKIQLFIFFKNIS
jgi:hypothetical protein